MVCLSISVALEICRYATNLAARKWRVAGNRVENAVIDPYGVAFVGVNSKASFGIGYDIITPVGFDVVFFYGGRVP